MKTTRIWTFCLLAFLLPLTGCLERQFAEDALSISVDRQEIVVPSDSDKGKDLVTDTVWVAANKSWTVQVEDGVDWVTCDLEGHRNLSQETDQIPVVLKFKDNEGDARSAKVLLSSEAGKQEVTVRQQKIAYRLAVENNPEDFLDLSYEPSTVKILIKTNTEWTIAVKEGSTFAADFSQTSGKYAGEVEMYVHENSDLEVKSGAVVITSPNISTPVEVAVSQAKSKPYAKFPEGDAYTALDGIDNIIIPIKANLNWTASIESVSGYNKDEVSLETASGDKTATQIKVLFPASYDFSKKIATIEVKLQAEGVETAATATISQTPCLRYCFGDPYTAEIHDRTAAMYGSSQADLDRVHQYWPFSKYEAEDGKGGWTAHDDGFVWLGGTRDKSVTVRCTLKHGGFIMHMFAGTQGINRSASWFSLGKDVTNYLGCPIVPGYSLRKVEYWLRGNGLHVQVQDANGKPVEGGDLQITSASQPYNKAATLSGTEPGAEYKIGYVKAGYWFRVSDVFFYYE